VFFDNKEEKMEQLLTELEALAKLEGIELVKYTLAYSFITLLFGLVLFKISPKRPYFSFIESVLISVPACWFLWVADWDFSSESLKQNVSWQERTALIFTIGYLLGDLPQYILRKETKKQITIFFIHHILSSITLLFSIYYGVNQRLLLITVSSELSTIPLNLIELVDSPTLKMVYQLLFVLLFIGHRICFIIFTIISFLIETSMQVTLTHFLMHYTALVVVGVILHGYWTYCLLVEIKKQL
jgi:hypothetical protein